MVAKAKGADQSVQMSRLFCTFVFHKCFSQMDSESLCVYKILAQGCLQSHDTR